MQAVLRVLFLKQPGHARTEVDSGAWYTKQWNLLEQTNAACP